MKIVQIISKIDSGGGAERLVVDLCNQMVQKGHEVILLTLRDNPVTSTYLQELSHKVRVVSLHKSNGFSCKLMFSIYVFLKRESPDVVNSHLGAVFPYMIYSICRLKKIRFYHTIHSVAIKEEPRKWLILVRRLLIRFDKIIFVSISKATYNSFVDLYHTKKSPIIYNGRDTLFPTDRLIYVQKEISAYKFDDKTKVFLSVGRISRAKNQKLLMNVFTRLYNDGYNVILCILGVDKHADKKILNSLEIDKPDNVFLLQAKPNVADYLYCADAFCLSSKYEGLPISILEAYAMGKPVLVTPVAGLLAVVKDGLNGFMSRDLSVQGYYDIICAFLSLSQDQIENIGKLNMDEYQNKYTIQKCAENYLKMYEGSIYR